MAGVILMQMTQMNCQLYKYLQHQAPAGNDDYGTSQSFAFRKQVSFVINLTQCVPISETNMRKHIIVKKICKYIGESSN